MRKSVGNSWRSCLLALALATVAQAQTPFPLFEDFENPSEVAEVWQTPDDGLWSLTTTAAQSGNRAWGIVPDAVWRYVTLVEPLSLVEAANPFLSIWVRTLDGRASYRIDVSTDGGATWQKVHEAFYETSLWGRQQVDLNAYTTQDELLVRVGGQRWTAGATIMFDDIHIDNAPLPTSLRLLDPGNNSFTIEWDASTASDFSQYRIILDTKVTDINDRNAAALVLNRRERRVYDVDTKSTTRIELDDVIFTRTRYFAKIYERDTQGFWNQGSELSETTTLFALDPEVAPFVQDFEGDFLWAADSPWAVTQAAQNEAGHSASGAWEDSPLGSDQANYADNTSRLLVGEMDFSGVQRPVLRFNHRYNFQAGDFGYVEFSTDSNVWIRIAEYTGAQGQWSQEEIDLSDQGRKSAVFLRFWLISNFSETGDGWNIDDVEVIDQEGTTVFPFSQDVEDEAQARSEWLGAGWEVTGTAARSGDLSWMIKPNAVWQWLTLAPTMDISAQVNPYLSLWLRSSGGRASYRIQVSSDGGANWIQGADSFVASDEWVRVEQRLEVFRGRDFRVRIGALRWNSGARLFVDDILIDNAPVPGVVRLGDLDDKAMSIDWDESDANDFKRYRIVLDSDRNGVEDLFTQGFVDNRRERLLFDFEDRGVTQLRLDDLLLVEGRYYVKLYEQDTQDLWNQGTVRAEAQLPFLFKTEVAPFVQDFEGSDFLWAGDRPWALTENAAEEEGHSGTHAWEDSPRDGPAVYPPQYNGLLKGVLDLSNVARPILYFNHRYNFQTGQDWGRVEYSLDGVIWVEIMRFTGVEGNWRREEYDLSHLGRQPRVQLRFRTTSDASIQADGWHIDDIEIAANERIADFPFGDDMENEPLTLDNWIGGDWQLRATQAHSGDLAWEVGPGNLLSYLTMAGTVDLSRVAEPFLSLWLRTPKGRTLYLIEVSGDGGVNWTRLVSSSSLLAEWTHFEASLADFRSTRALVRIGAQVAVNGGILQVDDVSIEFPPTIFGDASGDKEVTVFDAALILQHVVGLRNLRGPAFDAAEVSGNGSISPYDAALVLQFVTGLIDSFPVEDDGSAKAAPVAARMQWGKPQIEGDGSTWLPLRLMGVTAGAAAAEIEIEVPEGVRIDAVKATLPEDWTLVHRFESGVIRLALAGSGPLPAGSLARLRFDASQGSQAAITGHVAFNDQAPQALNRIEVTALPQTFALEQNFPNPFNPNTQIRYRLPAAGRIELGIFNVVGQQVRRLVEGTQVAGLHQVDWDGRDEAGHRVESGLYFYRLETDAAVQTRKMLLVK
jgi:hypothetical protein